MLVASTRLTAADRDHWRTLERFDKNLADGRRLGFIADLSRKVIRDFASIGPCYVSTSWGKDSVVLAHLAETSGTSLPLVYLRVRRVANPDCDQVRDAFFTRHPDAEARYEEIEIDFVSQRWWEPADPGRKRAPGGGFLTAEARHGGRHISGVRAEESPIRGLAMARWGHNSRNSSRPIGHWTTQEVFSFLAVNDLPVHPAYAMTAAGTIPRGAIRVHAIGGMPGTGRGRAEWEQRYYGDIVRNARETT